MSVDAASGGTVQAPKPVVELSSVLANPRFMSLYLSQVLTQVGGNMVLYGLTIQVFALTGSSTSVSILLLTFLVPAVVFGAVAGVYSDQFDRRLILVVANVLRGACFVGLVVFNDNLVIFYLLIAVVATLTTFFGPAEAAMIPKVVDRSQLLAANGLFVFTLQASFVLGFAVLGPLFQRVLGTQVLTAVVAGCYLLAAGLCWVLPPSPPPEKVSLGLTLAERALAATLNQLREGLVYIARHRAISWSLLYLAITASLIGVLGVLGPSFAVHVLGLSEDDFVVIVLPLGAGLVVGILSLNVYGKYVPRRRLIEGGLVTIGLSLAILGLAQRVSFIKNGSGALSLLSVVMAVAFVAGVAYAFVAVPAQTQLQEELPSEVRGRVFGVLNMLVSLASFLPIVIVGPVADAIGTSAVIVISAVIVAATGVASISLAHPAWAASGTPGHLEPVDPIAVATSSASLTRPVHVGPMANRAGDEQSMVIEILDAESEAPADDLARRPTD
jgi:MFS family permease